MARRRDRGSATVEFALVLPILLVVSLAVVQIGLLVRDQLVLVAAARSGAREAAVTGDDGEVRAAVERAATTIAPGAISMEVGREGPRGATVSVNLVYRAPIRVPFVGWLFPPSVQLHARAAMRQEFG
jgi:Flp pilus assembly protein TadG